MCVCVCVCVCMFTFVYLQSSKCTYSTQLKDSKEREKYISRQINDTKME